MSELIIAIAMICQGHNGSLYVTKDCVKQILKCYSASGLTQGLNSKVEMARLAECIK